MSASDSKASQPATAVVMNMFYTGLGIARSLGERGVPVIGLSAESGVYGNFTRHAKTVRCADSRSEPEQLLKELLDLGPTLGQRAVLFPTRDHDLVFLDRFRSELTRYYEIVAPSSTALKRCLNKWDTYVAATEAGVATPKCWLIDGADDLARVAAGITYPCVLKPLEAHHWRAERNWEIVGARKAIAIASAEELLAEYEVVGRANRRALVQAIVPGGDDCLNVVACYVDREGRFVGGFNVQKLVQDPPGFGTGCIVQSADRPELFERTIRLLRAMEFTGIAEVEYKREGADGEYKLIEVNPRPWDQHRLGAVCGVDVIHLAYRDCAGLPTPEVRAQFTPCKWIAEDAFLMAVLRSIWRRDGGARRLFQQARGRKIYAIWAASDPMPFLAYLAKLVPTLIGLALSAIRRAPGEAAARQKPAMRALP